MLLSIWTLLELLSSFFQKHDGLLLKLQTLGLTGDLGNFMQGFLDDRKLCVRVAEATSSTHPLNSGVLQGSVLNPTLFFIFINDIFVGIPEQVRSSLYADDGDLWVTASELPAPLTLMQAALDSVASWTHTWRLSIAKAITHAIVSPLEAVLFLRLFSLVVQICYLSLLFDFWVLCLISV